ncbi:DUF6493 family protein [Pedobacter aquatilis]|uniref:DUF6493 family protein n=1 Tax=Pedobacter aquatilis TaxID=351343 RepID=UPI00292CAED1|nr:DUF6493 family protein [Pedobacter aquatilis]
MKKHLKYIEGSSDKFWQIETSDLSYTVTYGKNGTNGTSQSKYFTTTDECLKAAEKLLNDKIKKGYSESGEVMITASKTLKENEKNLDKQTIIAEYDKLLKSKNVNDLLSFLQRYAKGNIDLLKKHIKTQKRYYMNFVDLSKEPGYPSNHWGTRGDEFQKTILTLSAIAIFNKSDLITWEEVSDQLTKARSPEVIDILHWAKPNWITELLLERVRKNEWRNMPYQTLRFLEAEGLITYEPELYARSIAQFNEWSAKINHTQYIDYIVNDELAFKRDVPAVFEYETGLQNSYFKLDKDAPYDQYKTWEVIFTKLLESDKIARSYFIEQCILMQTKDWNTNLKSFFRKRLAALAPNSAELLDFQEQLFSCLQHPDSPIVNWATDFIKKMYDSPTFNAASFLDWIVPTMMSNAHKSGVKNLLSIFEKLAKLKPKLAKQMSLLIADSFVIPDLGLQEKATKTLLKIAGTNDAELTDKLNMYGSLMLGQTKTALAAYLNEDTAYTQADRTIDYVYQMPEVDVLDQPISLPQNWQEVFLLFGRFINSEEVADAELLLNAFITQRNLFPSNHQKQLQAYLQQLEKKYFESINKAYLSVFFQQKTKTYHEQFRVRIGEYHKVKTLLLIQPLLYTAQTLIDTGKPLPLLSFPSHYPHWVAPKVLIERLIAYIKNGVPIDKLDLSIAISRMPRAQVAEAIPLLDQLSGPIKSLMEFCLGVSNEINLKPQSLFKKLLGKVSATFNDDNIDAVWVTAARTFHPNATFEIFNQTSLSKIPFAVAPYSPPFYIKERWNEYQNYYTKKMERSESWQELIFEDVSFPMPPSYFLYAQDLTGKKNIWNYLLGNEGNVAYWHSLMPQNNDPLALYLLRSTCITANGGSGNDLKGFLTIVNGKGFKFSGLSIFLFACICFQEKKEIRLMASEVFINLVEKQAIDMTAFATKVAFLTNHKYGPFSRMIESTEAVKELSPLHQSAYLQLIEGLLANLQVDEKLPTNFRKLVENYVDLLYKTEKQPGLAAVNFFSQWKDNSTLKNLIKQILAPQK